LRIECGWNPVWSASATAGKWMGAKAAVRSMSRRLHMVDPGII
jgi:hypothetical protein